MAYTPTGTEIVYINPVDPNGSLAPILQPTTLASIAALAATESSPLVDTAITTVGNGTLTAAALLGGQITRSGPTSAYTDTTDTAANIVAALPGFVAGQTFLIRIKNATAFTQTLAAGTGVTPPATVLIPAFSVGNYFATVSSATAVSLTHMSTVSLTNNITVTVPAQTALNTVGAGTLLAANIASGYTYRGGSQSNTPFTDTTDTAANIIAAQPGLVNKIGAAFLYTYANNTNAPATIAGGTGVTVSILTEIPSGRVATYLITYTAAATLTMVGINLSDLYVSSTTYAGSSSGQTILSAAAAAGGKLTLPALVDTLAAGVAGACTATATYTSSTALTVPTGLSVALQAGTYRVRGVLQGTAAAAGGITAELTATNSLALTSANITGWNYNGATLNAVTNVTALAADFANSAAAYTNIVFDGTIIVSTAGTLNVSTAQHTSNASSTTVVAGSYLEVRRIS